jgi:hypothetical protein
MASTFKKLDSVTVGAGGVSSISFTNIPSGYTDLVIKSSTRTTGTNGTFFVHLNGTSTNSTTIRLYSASGVNSGGSGFANSYWDYGNYSSTYAGAFSNSEVYLPGYTNNGIFKTVAANTILPDNSTAWSIISTAGQKQNTEAVTSITIAPVIDPLIAQYSTFTLYGVFNQDVLSAPSAPTAATATAGVESASVAFTGVSGAASYTATSSPGGFTATGTASPLVVRGLTGGTSYTFTVKANNPLGSNTSAPSNSITAIYPAYDSIASTTVGAGGSPSEITFSSIPSGYTHLQLRFVGRSLASAPNDSILIRYNSDAGANYVIHRVYGEATGPSGGQGFLSQTYTIAGDMPATTASLSQTVGTSVVDILDYSNTSKNTTTRVSSGRNENGVGYVWLNSSLWLNTAAVSSITVLAANGSLAQYSRASLYGMKGA